MYRIAYTLLVDDDEITSFINQNLIEELHLSKEVVTAKDGQEALLLLKETFIGKEKGPSLVLLDLNMSLMDGFEFIEAFDKLEFEGKNSITIIVLTNSLAAKVMEDTESDWVKGFINKPLTEENLKSLIIKHF